MHMQNEAHERRKIWTKTAGVKEEKQMGQKAEIYNGDKNYIYLWVS